MLRENKKEDALILSHGPGRSPDYIAIFERMNAESVEVRIIEPTRG